MSESVRLVWAAQWLPRLTASEAAEATCLKTAMMPRPVSGKGRPGIVQSTVGALESTLFTSACLWDNVAPKKGAQHRADEAVFRFDDGFAWGLVKVTGRSIRSS